MPTNASIPPTHIHETIVPGPPGIADRTLWQPAIIRLETKICLDHLDLSPGLQQSFQLADEVWPTVLINPFCKTSAIDEVECFWPESRIRAILSKRRIEIPPLLDELLQTGIVSIVAISVLVVLFANGDVDPGNLAEEINCLEPVTGKDNSQHNRHAQRADRQSRILCHSLGPVQLALRHPQVEMAPGLCLLIVLAEYCSSNLDAPLPPVRGINQAAPSLFAEDTHLIDRQLVNVVIDAKD